jgi:hypothetical protein
VAWRDLPVAERLQTFDDGMTSHGRLPWRLADNAAVATSEIQCWPTPAAATPAGRPSEFIGIVDRRLSLDVSDHRRADEVLTQK